MPKDLGPPGGQDGEGRSSARPATVEQSDHCITSADHLNRQCNSTTQSWRRRHEAALRLPLLDCGCDTADPWLCRCNQPQLSDRMIDAYRDTMLHLRHHGLLAAPCLAEMQVLWRRGGDDRRLAAEIAARWELARMRPNELSPAQRPWLWRVVS